MTSKLNDCDRASALLPHPSPAVQRRMLATVHATGALILRSGSANPELQGCLVLPFARIVMAGTACARPLLFAECDALTTATCHDVIILRHDALRGTTFDIKLRSQRRWFRRYLATPVEGGVRMAPGIGGGVVLRATAFGLEAQDAPNAINLHSREVLRTPSYVAEA